MLLRTPTRFLLAVATFSAAVCLAQSAPPPCSTTPQPADKSCSSPSSPPVPSAPSAPPPPAAQQFPFPGEASQPAAPAPNAPNAPRPSADKDHPFPTESPDMPGEAPGASSSSGNSSSSSSSSSSDTGDDYNPDAARPARRKLPKVEKLQTPDQRVDEDLNVAKFYLNRDNYRAAYMRSKDAVKTEPDYAPTHFSLAQAAEKMKKLDEARAEYNAYLKLAPYGEDAKAARKALDGMK